MNTDNTCTEDQVIDDATAVVEGWDTMPLIRWVDKLVADKIAEGAHRGIVLGPLATEKGVRDDLLKRHMSKTSQIARVQLDTTPDYSDPHATVIMFADLPPQSAMIAQGYVASALYFSPVEVQRVVLDSGEIRDYPQCWDRAGVVGIVKYFESSDDVERAISELAGALSTLRKASGRFSEDRFTADPVRETLSTDY